MGRLANAFRDKGRISINLEGEASAMKKANVLSALMMVATLCGGIAILPYSSAAQGPAQQASPFKDRAEYDAFNAIEQAKDPSQQVELADKYLTAYPQSKVAERVVTVKLQAYQKLNKIPEVQQTAEKLIEINPKQVYALFLLSTLFPQTFNDKDPAAEQKLSAAVDHAKAGLEQTAALTKPANLSDEDFKKQKDQLDVAFHQTLGYASLQRKDYPAAAEELRKTVQIDPNNAGALYQLGVADRSMKPSKDDEALWAIARAISVTGPSALPPANQAQVKEYLGKVYENVHGSADGLDDVLKQTASAPTLPQDFHVKTADEGKPAEPEPAPQPVEAKRELSVKPEELTDFGVIQKYLQAGGQRSEDTWTLLKGQSFPLPGKVVAATPAARPKTIQLAVAPELQTQEGKYDVEVTLATPSAKPIAKGETITLEGTLDSFRARPFLLKLVEGKISK